MFKWKRSPADAPPGQSKNDAQPLTTPSPVSAFAAPITDDEALDAFASVLRAFGQHAFDLENESSSAFSQKCDAWARHLLVLSPPPTDDETVAGGDESGSQQAAARDWATVRQFLLARRQREQQHVNKSLGDLRQGICCLLYTSPSPRDGLLSRMPSSA